MKFRTKNNQPSPNTTFKTVSRPKCEKVRFRRKTNENNTNCVNNQKNNIKHKGKNSNSTMK